MKKMLIALLFVLSSGLVEAQTAGRWYRAEATEYFISTEEELREVARLTSCGESFHKKTIHLQNDLEISGEEPWVPIGEMWIGEDSYPFQGTFDGGGHTIVFRTTFAQLEETDDAGRMQVHAGLFGILGTYGTIENLCVDIPEQTISVSASGQYWYFGGLVCRHAGTMRGCKTSGDVRIRAPHGYNFYCAGAMIASVHVEAVVADCTNRMSIRADGISYVGGIAGESYNAVLDHCINEGDISSIHATGDGSGKNAGGITGRFTGSRSYGGILCNCINRGSISSDETLLHCGGLSGFFGGTVWLVNSANTGTVSSDADSIGGLVGCAGNDVDNCYNSGRVENRSGATGEPLLGYTINVQYTDHCFYCSDFGTSDFGKGLPASSMQTERFAKTMNKDVKKLNGYVADYLVRDEGKYLPELHMWRAEGTENGGYPEL